MWLFQGSMCRTAAFIFWFIHGSPIGLLKVLIKGLYEHNILTHRGGCPLHLCMTHRASLAFPTSFHEWVRVESFCWISELGGSFKSLLMQKPSRIMNCPWGSPPGFLHELLLWTCLPFPIRRHTQISNTYRCCHWHFADFFTMCVSKTATKVMLEANKLVTSPFLVVWRHIASVLLRNVYIQFWKFNAWNNWKYLRPWAAVYSQPKKIATRDYKRIDRKEN